MNPSNNQKGTVLVLALLIAVTMTLMVIGIHKASIYEIRLAGNIAVSKQAFYNAESGLELFKYDIVQKTIVDNNPTDVNWSSSKTYTDNGIRAEVTGTHVTEVVSGTTVVRMMNGKPVYRVQSHGYNRESHRITEVVFHLNPTMEPPAALWSRASVDIKGSSTYVNGKDTCGGIGTDKPGIETKGTVSQSGNPIIDGAPTINQNVSSNYPIEDVIGSLKGYASAGGTYTAGQTLTGLVFGDVQEGSTPQDPTTPLTDPKIVYYNMNGTGLTLNGTEGTGILLVDGSLKIGGGFQWYGIIVVSGTVTFSGGGEKNITGGVISGGTPNVDSTISGNMSIVYCSNVKDYLSNLPKTQRLSWREVF